MTEIRMGNTTFSDYEADTDYGEKNRRFVQNAIELVLSFGDFQKEINGQCTPQAVVLKAAERIARLIGFDASAIFLVDEETSDMHLADYKPTDAKETLESELDFQIQNGIVAYES